MWVNIGNGTGTASSIKNFRTKLAMKVRGGKEADVLGKPYRKENIFAIKNLSWGGGVEVQKTARKFAVSTRSRQKKEPERQSPGNAKGYRNAKAKPGRGGQKLLNNGSLTRISAG